MGCVRPCSTNSHLRKDGGAPHCTHWRSRNRSFGLEVVEITGYEALKLSELLLVKDIGASSIATSGQSLSRAEMLLDQNMLTDGRPFRRSGTSLLLTLLLT